MQCSDTSSRWARPVIMHVSHLWLNAHALRTRTAAGVRCRELSAAHGMYVRTERGRRRSSGGRCRPEPGEQRGRAALAPRLCLHTNEDGALQAERRLRLSRIEAFAPVDALCTETRFSVAVATRVDGAFRPHSATLCQRLNPLALMLCVDLHLG
eukprot:3752888-Pleurochrysis_carterae.AAC.2